MKSTTTCLAICSLIAAIHNAPGCVCHATAASSASFSHREWYDLLTTGMAATPDRRQLQAAFTVPDYTSPPLAEAVQQTPALYRNDDVIDEARDLDASGNCTVDENRCHIPFPVNKNDDAAVQHFDAPSRVGVLFYPGTLVDPRSYAPLATILNERYGLPVVIPIFTDDIALVFGVCDSGRLEYAQAEFPDVEKWVLTGHSLGGVVAALDTWTRWNTTHDATAAGLVLLAADVQENIGGCGITDFSVTDLPMAQVLASNDGTLNRTRTAQNRRYNSNATQFVEIYGANHASFGAYDSSERTEVLGYVDGESVIPDAVTWDTVAAAIANVAARTGVPLPTPKQLIAPVPNSDDVSSTTTTTTSGSSAGSGRGAPYSLAVPFWSWSVLVYYGGLFLGQ